MKIFSAIIQETVRRGWRDSNPCFRLEIQRVPTREKSEISDEKIAIIRAEIQRLRQRASSTGEHTKADFLHYSFEIALAQGCRMSETHLDLDDVNLEKMEIRFVTKGRKPHLTDLNPALVPLFQDLKHRKKSSPMTSQKCRA